MSETSPSNKWCCTCQRWHGERSYDVRRKRVKYENKAPSTPCSMGYKLPGAHGSGCRGYLRWYELG